MSTRDELAEPLSSSGGKDIELPSAKVSSSHESGDNADEEQGAPASSFHALPDSGEARGVGIAPNGSRAPQEASSTNAAPAASSWVSESTTKTIVTALYMSCFASLGCLLRIILAQLFGEECKNPGSVGWLAAGEPLCVTAAGVATQEGGVIYADLPANMLGSFIMGMMQTCAVLGLPKNMAIPWLKDTNAFQKWDILHLAIRTGFCGSLTTFSSWNSEMVVMIYGMGNNHRTQWALALFGYIVGLETAIGSFVFGKNVATWIFNRINPVLAREAEATRIKKEQGVHIDRNLPDFERRYLPDLDMEKIYYDPDLVLQLERWRESTRANRFVGNSMLPLLKEVESKALVLGQPLPEDLHKKAELAGWDVGALEAWADGKKGQGSDTEKEEGKPLYAKWYVALLTYSLLTFLLLLGVALCNEGDAPSITYRTMWYSCLLAPFGALLRWKLSAWNGKIGGPWAWFPAGTLSANLLASLISISLIAAELRLHSDDEMSLQLSLLALKIGFAGSLSTVSTFIAEVSSLMAPPSQYKGYKYVFITLASACLIGVAFYGWIVYVL